MHISFVGQDDGSDADRSLDGRSVLAINADLTSGLDLTRAHRLQEDLGCAFQGPVKVGAFDIDGVTAARLLSSPNPDGRDNRDVVRPWINGLDITRRPRGMWIIDFGELPEREAALYEAPFEYVRANVRAGRMAGRRARRAERWWLHGETVPGLRSAIGTLERYVATPRVSKYRIFTWAPAATLPDSAVVAIARDDDYTFGVLHSRAHELWARGTGTQLREVESGFRYTPTTCFETFPFPRPSGAQREAIATAASELVRLRDGWLNPPGFPDADLAKRTLTNLYNARPTWLARAHERLDVAVLDAFGWPTDIGDDEILVRLLTLNLERMPA